MNAELLYSLALTRINYFSPIGLMQLYREMGSATAVYEHRNDIRDVMPDASDRLVQALKNWDEPLRRAEAELLFDEKHTISPLCMNEADYPQRMKTCDDAPLVLFYKGSADLNPLHVINIVGTRHATPYGQDLIRRFVRDLRALCPDVLIISGLAYGIDICAHREALDNGLKTVGVLAHGLDELYPSCHRQTAIHMLGQGGLITEFMTMTNADKMNFVRRNRIVAGMSDATILVESAAKGGGLITCGIAQSYGRDVFAFPGRVGDEYSEGCNRLIQTCGAALLTSAEEFVKSMGWEDATLSRARQEGIEREIFPDLSADEQLIVDILRKNNDLQVNLLSAQTGLSIQQLTSLMFTLEMKGVVKPLAGGMYHLLG